MLEKAGGIMCRVVLVLCAIMALSSVAHAVNVQVSYTYDAIGRLNAVNYTSGQQMQYTFDKAGNITKVSAWDGTDPTVAPASITVPVTDPDGAYSVSWKASTTTGVTYAIEEASNTEFTQGLRTAYKGTGLTAPITGRSVGKTYFYRVKASKIGMIDSAWTSGVNGCAVLKVLAAPTTVTTPVNGGTAGFEVRWAASTIPGASYVLQAATDSTFSNPVTVYQGTALSFIITGKASGTTLYYRVKTVLPGYTDSPWKISKVVKVLTSVGTPGALVVPMSDPDGAYTVSWGASSTSGVTYVLEEATDPDFNLERRTAYTGTLLKATITGRASAKIYYYRIIAKKAGAGDSAWLVGLNGCAMNGAVAAPGVPVVPISDPDGGYTVSWAKSATSGVTYTLEEASLTDFSNSSVIYTGTLLSKAITGKSAGTYYYRLKATRTGYTETAWIKGANGCMVKPVVSPPATILVPATGGTEGYTVSWGASPTQNVTYILEEANNLAFTGSTLIYSGSGLSKLITGKIAGSSWYYRVKAYQYGYAASSWKVSGKVSVLTSAGMPGSITVPASDADGSYVVQWTASATPGVTYTLEEATNSAFTAGKRTINGGTGLSVNITGRTRGLTYYYRVLAGKSGYANSIWKTSANGCVILNQVASPGTVTVPATSGNRNVTISWGKSVTDGVTYIVEAASDTSFTYPEQYSGIQNLSLVYWYPYYSQNISATRYFRVKAHKEGYADSAWKTGVNAAKMLSDVLPPAGLTVPSSDPDGAYTVSWNASPTSSVTYVLEEAQDEQFTVGKRTAYTGTGRTYAITARVIGKTYYYRVKAKKTGMGDSIWITHDPSSGLTGVQKIAQGFTGHNLALMTDKTVYSWGNNRYGQVGESLTALPQGVRTSPAQVQGLEDVKDIAAGIYFSAAVKNDGTVWTWGYNNNGQLGDASGVSERFTPQQVPGLSGVIKVAAGYGHVLALKSDGTVWAWGRNYKGELGNGTTSGSLTPIQVPGLSNVKDISAGWYTSLALLENGSVWAWGDNEYGSLGNGSTAMYSNTPVSVSGLPQISAIDAGSVHNLVLATNGSVWAWGGNGNGQVGDGTTVDKRTTPVQVMTNAQQVAAGWSSSFALKSDGSFYAWGGNHDGDLGLGTDTWSYNSPTLVSLNSVQKIFAGGNGLAVMQDGTTRSWGYNWDGAVGDGTLTDRLSPVYVVGPGTNSCQVMDAKTFGIWSFNECDGKDDSGNGRDATIHGTECLAGHNGDALHFSNSANTGYYDKKDWVTLPNITANSITFRAWIKWQQATNYDPAAAIWSVGDHGASFLALFVNSNTGEIRIIQGNNTYSYSGVGDVSDGEWHYVEVIASQTSASFYLDHQLKGMTTLQNPITFANAPHYLSYHQWQNGASSSSRFYGFIDEVQILSSN